MDPVQRIGAAAPGVGIGWPRVGAPPVPLRRDTPGPRDPDRDGGRAPDPHDGRDSLGQAVTDAARFWFFGGRVPQRDRVPVLLTAGDRPHPGRGGIDAEPAGQPARTAARSLGLGPFASQADIDRRFREIVKAERPDLGAMRPEVLHRLAEQRDLLRAAAGRAALVSVAHRYGVADRPERGTHLDVAV